MFRSVLSGVVIAGCAYKNPASTDAQQPPHPDAPADASVDSPLDPCTLPELTLTAATLAGCSSSGTTDGPRGVARFNNPVNVALGPSGIAYIPDFDSSRLRKVDPAGNTSTILVSPQFNRPFGIIMLPDGFLYVESDDDDLAHHGPETGMIWKVNPATGEATVVLRDHGRPRGLALLPDGRIATTDYIHDVIEIVDPLTGTATPLAGVRDIYGHNNSPDGSTATFDEPWDLVLDQNGDLIVSEFTNNVLRRVTLAGEVTDFAGTGTGGHMDGTLAAAQFFNPKGLAIDASGAIYVSEAGNHMIRKIANGMVSTVAGTSGGGYHDDNDPLAAAYYGVEGLDVSADGTRIVVADGNNGDAMPFNHIRVITP